MGSGEGGERAVGGEALVVVAVVGSRWVSGGWLISSGVEDGESGDGAREDGGEGEATRVGRSVGMMGETWIGDSESRSGGGSRGDGMWRCGSGVSYCGMIGSWWRIGSGR